MSQFGGSELARRVLILALCAWGLCVSGGARADLGQSQAWFNGLPADQRREIQYDLIWLADYSGVVDGIFGQQTYASLTKYQEVIREPSTGKLSQADVLKLKSDVEKATQTYDFSKYSDDRAGLEYLIPNALLASPAPAAKGKGTKYSSADDTFSLESFRIEGGVFEDH